MILQALTAYYDRYPVPPLGFFVRPISFCLILRENGEIADVNDLRDSTSKKPVGTEMEVPAYIGKRTSGAKAYFCWDKSAYVLGRDLKMEGDENDKKRAKNLQNLKAQHADFVALHRRLLKSSERREAKALLAFLDHWKPELAETLLDWPAISSTNLVFSLEKSPHVYLHTLPEFVAIWSAHLAKDEASTGYCLVTGSESPIALTHPAIKGVSDPSGQAEKSLVSFNADAFCSLGRDQNANAPLSVEAAFKYTTALNRLLGRKTAQLLHMGDTTIVYWTDSKRPKSTAAEAAIGQIINPRPAPQDRNLLELVKTTLESTIAGKTPPAEIGDPSTLFYLLGITPNSSRIAVRFWHVARLDDLLTRLSEHYSDMAWDVAKEGHPPGFWSLSRELLPMRKGQQGPEQKKNGKFIRRANFGLTQAALTGNVYPAEVFYILLTRLRGHETINSDGDPRHTFTRARFHLLLACLNRQSRLQQPNDKRFTMKVDKTRPDPAYRIGRLFAALERIQEVAYNESSPSKKEWPRRTIKDSYFSSASSTPAVVFHRLVQLSTHHARKLESGFRTGRGKEWFKTLLAEIHTNPMDGQGLLEYPVRLSPREQGIFCVGYYHQRQEWIKPKYENEPEPEQDEADNSPGNGEQESEES